METETPAAPAEWDSRFHQQDDAVLTKCQKRALISQAHALRPFLETLPRLVRFITNISYRFVPRPTLEARNAALFLELFDSIMLTELRQRTGQPGLQLIKPRGTSLYQRTTSCKLHYLQPGDRTGWHQDTQTRAKGTMLFTAVYNVQITVDGQDTLDPVVRSRAREEGRLPVMHLFNADEQVFETLELYTGLMMFHNGLKDYHSVPPLEPGVERICCVMFTSEDITPMSPLAKLPYIAREARGLARNKRLIEQVTGTRLPRKVVEYTHIIIAVGVALLAVLLLGASVGVATLLRRAHQKRSQIAPISTLILKDVD